MILSGWDIGSAVVFYPNGILSFSPRVAESARLPWGKPVNGTQPCKGCIIRVRVPKANDATLSGLIPFFGPSPGVADSIGNAGLNDFIPLGYRKRRGFYPNGIASFSPRVAESAKATLGQFREWNPTLQGLYQSQTYASSKGSSYRCNNRRNSS